MEFPNYGSLKSDVSPEADKLIDQFFLRKTPEEKMIFWSNIAECSSSFVYWEVASVIGNDIVKIVTGR